MCLLNNHIDAVSDELSEGGIVRYNGMRRSLNRLGLDALISCNSGAFWAVLEEGLLAVTDGGVHGRSLVGCGG